MWTLEQSILLLEFIPQSNVAYANKVKVPFKIILLLTA